MGAVFGESLLGIFNTSTSTDEVPRWHSEPSARGTWSVISTCVITLGLSVWTAVHLNIPKNQGSQTLSRVGWVLLGLLMPEVMISIAFQQNAAANDIRKDTMKSLGRPVPESHSWRFFRRRKPCADIELAERINTPQIRSKSLVPWTKTHGFYTIMGGFALNFEGCGEPFLPKGLTRLILTPKGLQELLVVDPDLLPSISEADIVDKSKANGFAKGLVCLQIVWFCLQCIARIPEDLSISLLELTTVAHCVCALLIYCLWWKKPVDVMQPTLIDIRGERLRAICAHMWMSSTASEHYSSEFESMKFSSAAISEDTSRDMVFPLVVDGRIDSNCPPADRVRKLTGFSVNIASRRFNQEGGGDAPPVHLDPIIKLQKSDLLRWELASKAIVEYGRPTPDITGPDFLVIRASSLRGGGKWNGWTSVIFALTQLVYGGLHAAAWNYHFISPGEQFYWRLAVLTIISPYPLLICFHLASLSFGLISFCREKISGKHQNAGSDTVNRGTTALVAGSRKDPSAQKRQRSRDHIISRIRRYSGYFVLGMLGLVVTPVAAGFCIVMVAYVLLYPCARFYVVVLGFKDIFYSSSEIFQQPVWTSFIPHIG